MKKVTECAVCAWRGECKKKFSYETSGLYCNDFTRDLALDAPKASESAKPEKREKPKKD